MALSHIVQKTHTIVKSVLRRTDAIVSRNLIWFWFWNTVLELITFTDKVGQHVATDALNNKQI